MSKYLGAVDGFEILLLIEGCALLLIVAFAWVYWGAPPPRWLIQPLGRLARRRRLCVVLMGFLAGTGSAVLSTFVYRTQPRIHDEFSYLLAADTFAHGRLSNPPHPCWVHFETFHVLQAPTYASKYPPGQGLVLAAGQVLGSSPRVGIWLGMALLGGSLCWMLQGWLPPRWALLGSVLITGRLVLASPFLGTVGYWGHSYWGGAVAGVGGALLFGALRRLVRRPSAALIAVFATGLVVLASSRPFEGLVVSLPAGGLLLLTCWRRGKACLLQTVGVMLAVLVPAALLLGVYNAAVTGDPWKLPYLLHEETYAGGPSFLWQRLRPEPVYNHELLRSFHTGFSTAAYHDQQTLTGLAGHQFYKLLILWLFFVGSTQTLALSGLLFPGRRRWTWFALGVCAVLLLSFFLQQAVLPHYAAPVTGLVAYLIIQGCRQLRQWRFRSRPVGRAVVQAVGVAVLLVWSTSVAFALLAIRSEPWYQQRARLAEQLAGTPGKHLVLVRYRLEHNVHREWVYNGADLEEASVIWAREMGGQRDRALREHYAGRTVWLLEADERPHRLTHFPASGPVRQPSDPHIRSPRRREDAQFLREVLDGRADSHDNR
jgi:hypothetical protein